MQAQNVCEIEIKRSGDLTEWDAVVLTPEMIDGDGNLLVPTSEVRDFYRLQSTYIELPAVTSQPTSTQIPLGSSINLSVTASGASPLSYQWYEGMLGVVTKPVGINSASFQTPVLMAPKKYWVRISNAAGSVDSEVANITVDHASWGALPLTQIASVGDSISRYMGSPGYRDVGFQTVARYRSGSKFDFLKNPTDGDAPYFATSGGRLYYQANVIVPGHIDQAIAAGAKLVFGHFGTNDVQNGGTSMTTIDGFIEAYRDEVEKIHAAGALFVGSTLVGPSASQNNPAIKEDYARANAAIRELSETLGFPLADFAEVTGTGNPGETRDEYISPLFGGDNLHPTPAGMNKMGEEMFRVIQPYLGNQMIEDFWSDLSTGVYGLELTPDYLFSESTAGIPDGGYGFALGAGGSSVTHGRELAGDGNWWTFEITDTAKTGEHVFSGHPLPGAGHKGLAQGATLNSVTLSGAASNINNAYSAANRNHWIWITGGLGAGQVRRITNYDGPTKTATVDADWVIPPDSSSSYEVGTRNGERMIVTCEVELNSAFELRGIGLLLRSQVTPRNIGDAFSGGASISGYPLDVSVSTAGSWVFRSPVVAVDANADRWRPRLILRGQGSGKIRRFGVWAVDRSAGQLSFTP